MVEGPRCVIDAFNSHLQPSKEGVFSCVNFDISIQFHFLQT
jgi:hypothetical protein